MQPREQSQVERCTTVQDAIKTCPSCGDGSAGRFCSNCGEEKGRDNNYSLLHHLGETFNVITNFESSLFRSFAALIRKPGLLTSDYFAGRRKPYLKPLQLFLFCNLIFFFVQSYTGFNTLSTPLSIHTKQLPYSSYALRQVNRAVVESGTTLEEYEARFNAIIETQAKTLVVLMIPIFALLMQALYLRSGRYFVEHLVFSTHFYSFFLLLLSAMLLLGTAANGLARRLKTSSGFFQSDLFYTTALLLCCMLYLLFMLRGVYAQGRTVTFLKCLILTMGIMFVIQLYRFILFFTALYSA